MKKNTTSSLQAHRRQQIEAIKDGIQKQELNIINFHEESKYDI